MKKTKAEIIEENAPGISSIEKMWMTTFWETFSDLVIEIDARYRIKNILKKTDSTFTMSDAVGKSFLDIATDKDRAFVENELELLKSTDVPYRRFTFLSILGRYYRWTLIALYNDDKFLGFRGIAVDVTIQSLNEITLNWQRAIIEGSNDFISIADIDGNVLYTNPGAYYMTGYDPALGAVPMERILTTELLKALRLEGLDKAVGEGSWSALSELLCMDGTIIPIEYNIYSVKNEQDKVFLITTIIRNITDFVKHEKELEKARRTAEAASKAKGEFLSRMSHEIRTPMNAIIGMINIGIGTENVDKKNYCFKRADNAAKHLLGIINGILDMSKIEAGKFELSYRSFSFKELINNITNLANIEAEKKQQNVIVNLSDDIPEFILSDELKLSQVITNLLTNATKFTPEKGTITLSINKNEEINDVVILGFEVSDTGIGISKEQQKRLFLSFNQADSSISQKFGGTGLGLAISKHIVKLLGGEIWIESELNLGAKFIFTIKAKIVNAADINKSTENARCKSAKRRYNFQDKALLVAEDVEINREIMSEILEETGISIDYAENGKKAVDMFRENPGKYNLILMDINMPEIDGFEATRQIRALDFPEAKNIIIIAMTANVFKEDIEKCLLSGMNDHTGKPIDSDLLFEQLNKYLTNPQKKDN